MPLGGFPSCSAEPLENVITRSWTITRYGELYAHTWSELASVHTNTKILVFPHCEQVVKEITSSESKSKSKAEPEGL